MSPVKAPNPTFSQSKWDSVVLYFIVSPSGNRLRILSSSVMQSSLLHVSASNKNQHQSVEWSKQRVLFNADKSSVIVVCLCEYVLYWQRASVLDSILIRPVWEPDTLVLPFMMTEFTNLHLDTLLAKWLHRERARERDYLLYCILVHFYDILIDIPWTVTSSIFFLV